MSGYNGVYDNMVREATEKVANEGWKDAPQNAVTLASFGMLQKSIEHRISSVIKPLRWGVLTIATGVIWYVVSGIFGL